MSFEQNPIEQLKLRKNSSRAERPAFPQPDFERDVLRPIFDQHRDKLLMAHVLVLRAHTLMLTEQRLVKTKKAALVLRALRAIHDGGPALVIFSPTAEDVSRAIDQFIEECRSGRCR
jgi:argininosuccinate lyase